MAVTFLSNNYNNEEMISIISIIYFSLLHIIGPKKLCFIWDGCACAVQDRKEDAFTFISR